MSLTSNPTPLSPQDLEFALNHGDVHSTKMQLGGEIIRRNKKVYKGVYDFAVQGGAIGTVKLYDPMTGAPTQGPPLPGGPGQPLVLPPSFLITDSQIDILTALTSASGVVGLNLGNAGTMAVLAGSAITVAGGAAVNLTGDIGISPNGAGSVTGFPPGTFTGTEHAADAYAAQAQIDLTAAYNSLATRPGALNISGLDLAGQTLNAGVYQFSSSAAIGGGGTLTLDAQGNANAIWIFQIGSTLTTSNASVISVINGGSAANVFFQVGSSATLGNGSTFLGSILALTSITVGTTANVSGRLLARNGAVTFAGGVSAVIPVAQVSAAVSIGSNVSAALGDVLATMAPSPSTGSVNGIQNGLALNNLKVPSNKTLPGSLPTVTIAGAALTGGKFNVFFEGYLSD